MLEALKIVLEIQELDIKLMDLMSVKNRRIREAKQIKSIENNLERQLQDKEHTILEIKKLVKVHEAEIQEVVEKIEKLESQQHSVKKVDEFNALSHEMAAAEKEKNTKEARLSDLYDRLATEEDSLNEIAANLKDSKERSAQLLEEVKQSIEEINQEGQKILAERKEKEGFADPEVLSIYKRLLENKRDRVVVPVENRACSGCHIVITAQDENLVRKGERILFCEHCSRIHYWPDFVKSEEESSKPSRRRRKAAATF